MDPGAVGQDQTNPLLGYRKTSLVHVGKIPPLCERISAFPETIEKPFVDGDLRASLNAMHIEKCTSHISRSRRSPNAPSASLHLSCSRFIAG